ncbi:hypothetical protein L195_g026655 [Trifolium pratense]|uniref:Uncharacterized protein n=1 Tax=Trifolium pratense TaxID=57577 RepID=A0A2K3NJV8_TRIPR|nr:hypothetical protein L195_g026655 [Trifolium pratense]
MAATLTPIQTFKFSHSHSPSPSQPNSTTLFFPINQPSTSRRNKLILSAATSGDTTLSSNGPPPPPPSRSKQDRALFSIVVSGTDRVLRQVVEQLQKLVNVLKV